jgi:ribosome recycling factor
MKLSIIIPCKNESGNILELYRLITDILGKIKYELIFVDDGSNDDTLDILKKLYNDDVKHIKILSFSRNFKMEAAVLFLDDSLARIRAGKANARILDAVRVEYYGSMTPLSGVASITTPDARTIAIQPWEKAMIREIERAIMASEVGITPENNGEIIRLCIPPLTEDRRKALVKQAKQEGEDAKISVRNARRDAIDQLKKAIKDGLPEDAEKDAEANVQKAHDRFIKEIDEKVALKEKEIMTV